MFSAASLIARTASAGDLDNPARLNPTTAAVHVWGR
jgi:hypothetical protein